jgi:hypothetical protein
VADCYSLFEQRMAGAASAGASKQERVRGFVLDQARPEFRIADIRRALPGVSDQTIRLVLAALRDEGAIVSTGGGPGARWRRLAGASPAASQNRGG